MFVLVHNELRLLIGTTFENSVYLTTWLTVGSSEKNPPWYIGFNFRLSRDRSVFESGVSRGQDMFESDLPLKVLSTC